MILLLDVVCWGFFLWVLSLIWFMSIGEVFFKVDFNMWYLVFGFVVFFFRLRILSFVLILVCCLWSFNFFIVYWIFVLVVFVLVFFLMRLVVIEERLLMEGELLLVDFFKMDFFLFVYWGLFFLDCDLLIFLCFVLLLFCSKDFILVFFFFWFIVFLLLSYK